jgi:malate/lactate dehydrogenase
VPVRLGAGGVKEIIEVKLEEKELKALQKSCQDVEANIKKIPEKLLK